MWGLETFDLLEKILFYCKIEITAISRFRNDHPGVQKIFARLLKIRFGIHIYDKPIYDDELRFLASYHPVFEHLRQIYSIVQFQNHEKYAF